MSIVSGDTGSRRHASIFDSPDGASGGAEAANGNARAFSPECSSSSSIGKNSDLDLSDGGEDDQVQSSYKGSLDSVNDLEEALPMRRGISSLYNGKSKSFASLAEASSLPCIKEIAKPENAYSRKRKNLIAFRHGWEKKGGASKRPLRSCRSTAVLAVVVGSSGSISDASTDSTSGSNAVSPTAHPPLHPQAWRSFSVADLQQCSGGSVVVANMNARGFFK